MRLPLVLASLATLFLASTVSSFSFKFYGNSGCRDELPGNIEVYGPSGGTDGCISSHNKGGARGVIVGSTGPVDDKFGVRFYETEGCDPTGKILSVLVLEVFEFGSLQLIIGAHQAMAMGALTLGHLDGDPSRWNACAKIAQISV